MGYSIIYIDISSGKDKILIDLKLLIMGYSLIYIDIFNWKKKISLI